MLRFDTVDQTLHSPPGIALLVSVCLMPLDLPPSETNKILEPGLYDHITII